VTAPEVGRVADRQLSRRDGGTRHSFNIALTRPPPNDHVGRPRPASARNTSRQDGEQFLDNPVEWLQRRLDGLDRPNAEAEAWTVRRIGRRATLPAAL